MVALWYRLLMLVLALALALPTGWCCAAPRSDAAETEHVKPHSCCQPNQQAPEAHHCCLPEPGQPAVDCCCERPAAIRATSVDAPETELAWAAPTDCDRPISASEKVTELVTWPEMGTARQARLCVWRL